MEIRGSRQYGWRANRQFAERQGRKNHVARHLSGYGKGILTILSLILSMGLIYTFLPEINQNLPDIELSGTEKDHTSAMDGKGPESLGLAADHAGSRRLAASELKRLISPDMFFNLGRGSVILTEGHEQLHVKTSLDTELQQKILAHIGKTSAPLSGIVVMDASNGEILAMAGRNSSGEAGNPCTSKLFPAASLFKLVTAAAVIEEENITPEKKFAFNGRRHTLYRSQLREGSNRYSNFISLKDAFALSINPVFGKIGIHMLGKKGLERYAAAFAFKKDMDFELPVTPSRFSLSDNEFNLAEVASGFNREIRISPLHAAMMASAVANDGIMTRPVLIKKIYDSRGNAIYQNSYAPMQRSMAPETAAFLDEMMRETVKSGTARKAFAGYRRDSVLSELVIGGKTGTIDSRDHDIRYDWFCGFARERDGNRKIAVAVLTGHKKPHLDTRSSTHARYIIKEAFRKYISRKSASRAKNRTRARSTDRG